MLPLAPDDALVVESVRFPSGPLQLEGELVYLENSPAISAAVVAGPHPLLGGTIRNNVVTGLADGLARRQVATLRFNYRGTGDSEGPRADMVQNLAEFWATSHVPEEPAFRDDLAAAIDFLRESLGGYLLPCLVGYSFGCSLFAGAAEPDTPLVLVAPTVGTHDYTAFQTISNPILVIASEDDFAANAARVRPWFDALRCPKQFIQGPFDNHFFRGHEDWLAETVFGFLDSHRRDNRCA